MIQDYQANKQPKEYWVNVYEYETVKNTQFYSHLLPSIIEANFRATMRKIARPDSKVVYRIHVKMKEKKPKYDDYKEMYKKS